MGRIKNKNINKTLKHKCLEVTIVSLNIKNGSGILFNLGNYNIQRL